MWDIRFSENMMGHEFLSSGVPRQEGGTVPGSLLELAVWNVTCSDWGDISYAST